MVFDISNETDVYVLSKTVKAFQDQSVEFSIERDCTFEAGCERTYVKLVV